MTITTRVYVRLCHEAMVTADVILPGRLSPKSPQAGVMIVERVAAENDLTAADLLGPSHERRIAWPRQDAFVALRDELGWSSTRIGRLFRRDHTTVLYGLAVAKERRGVE